MKFLVFVTLAVSAVAQIPGQMENFSLRQGLLKRNYRLYVPSNWTTADDPIPLVLNWHGLTNTPEDQAAVSGANEYADLYGWAIAYPFGYLKSHNGGACCAPSATLRVDDVKFAKAIVDDVAKKVAVRRDAVFSIGFSNGGFMTERIACDAADYFAAAGSNSGRRAFGANFKSCNPAKPIPVIAITGTVDPLVPYVGNPLLNFPSFTQDRQFLQEAMGCNSSEVPQRQSVAKRSTCELYTDCSSGAFLEYCTVQLGGHNWFTAPNIDSTGYFFMRFAQLTPGLAPAETPFLDLPKVEISIPESLA